MNLLLIDKSKIEDKELKEYFVNLHFQTGLVEKTKYFKKYLPIRYHEMLLNDNSVIMFFMNSDEVPIGMVYGMDESFYNSLNSVILRKHFLKLFSLRYVFNKKLIKKVFSIKKQKNNVESNTNQKKYRLVGIGITKEHQGKGYGKILLEKLSEFAKNKQYSNLVLKTPEGNEGARKFYKNYGLSVENILDGNYNFIIELEGEN